MRMPARTGNPAWAPPSGTENENEGDEEDWVPVLGSETDNLRTRILMLRMRIRSLLLSSLPPNGQRDSRTGAEATVGYATTR